MARREDKKTMFTFFVDLRGRSHSSPFSNTVVHPALETATLSTFFWLALRFNIDDSHRIK